VSAPTPQTSAKSELEMCKSTPHRICLAYYLHRSNKVEVPISYIVLNTSTSGFGCLAGIIL